MSGTLFLCGTPIGNLEDMTMRAVRILKEADLIAAEDTRHTLKLLNYFEIKAALISYHEHNKHESGKKIVEQLKQGKNVALVTDAGMPGISDPGEDLVTACYNEGITVTAVPGPSAFLTGLVLSGLSTRQFVFIGFLPTNKKNRHTELEKLVCERRTCIFYEAPHHLKKTLEDMMFVIGDRQIALARELTKRFEEVLRFTLREAIEYYAQNEPKGEYVIVLEGADDTESAAEKWEGITVEQHVNNYLQMGLGKMESIKAVAKDRKVKKSEIYKIIANNELEA